MKFATLERAGLVPYKTPLENCGRFAQALGRGDIWIKRDDLLPYGSNKTRKLDYLLPQAVAAGADTVITASTNQCNHNLLTLLAANRLGLKTQMIMESWGDPSYTYEAAQNRVLFELAGAERVETLPDLPSGPVEDLPLARQMADELERQGRSVYYMPRGGMGPLGACGYVQCVREMKEQGLDEFDVIVCPSGIGGTQAGLLAGLALCGCKARVLGIVVTQKSREVMEQSVYGQACELLAFLEEPPLVKQADVVCLQGYSGEGYAKPTAQTRRAIALLAETEGIFTDPVYSGKALAGLMGLVESGAVRREEKVLFLHTGGLSSAYDYTALRGIYR